MLKGISPLLSPELLAELCKMGHGDEIVLSDAHFPADTFGARVIRADGIRVPDLLDAILPLMVLDEYVESPVFHDAGGYRRYPGSKGGGELPPGNRETLPPMPCHRKGGTLCLL
jgi:hypothetical protein